MSQLRLVLLLLLLLAVGGTFGKKKDKHLRLAFNATIPGFTEDETDLVEFNSYCKELEVDRHSHHYSLEHSRSQADQCSATEANEFDKDIDPKMLLTLIMIVAWGALVRAVLNSFDIPLPYTVVLMCSGLIVGFFSKTFCVKMYEYTAIARISSKAILYTFLPILIFESAFNIPVHKFYRSGIQILIVAFPGMLFCTFFVSVTCMYYFTSYKWTFHQANLFGSIISATDPVAVVAILRELGVSEVLSVMIEGESLLNDGVAILLYEIFIEFVEAEDNHHEKESPLHLALKITRMFFQIAVGGPIFGWFMAKISIFLLSYVYNDAAVEISATIVAAYLTYYIAEGTKLGVSGVMAVVFLGLTMRGERTVISPESEGAVHHFWEILGYLANTVLFVLVGIIITETALTRIELQDYLNLFLLYVTIHVSRFIMLLLFYPILQRIGYGLTWQNMVIMTWGGLRGAVGICLALEVFRHEQFCRKPPKERIGDKMLFQTCGIVFLTLFINGTTTKSLLNLLNLTDISSGRKEEMNNAVKRIHRVKGRWIRIFKLSSKLYDADWNQVNNSCHVNNPYKEVKVDPSKVKLQNALEPPRPVLENTTVCWNCSVLVQNEPTTEEYRDLTEDARSRVVKAMTIAYYRLFEVGLISDSAVQILIADAERVEDQYLTLIHAKNFEKYFHIRGLYPWLKKTLRKYEKNENVTRTERTVPKFRRPFRHVVTKDWFEWLIMLFVLLNVAQIAVELKYNELTCDNVLFHAFKYMNMFFLMVYLIEFVFKILGYTLKEYICDFWNYIDIVVLILAFADITYTMIFDCNKDKKTAEKANQAIKIIRFIRIIRIARLFKPLAPILHTRISKKIHEQLFLGFDIAGGFVHASDEVLKFLPQMIENRRVLRKVKAGIDAERAECMQKMSIFQQANPGIAIAVKTRHACRSVLNTMKDSLTEQKDDGLLDDTEVDLIARFLETKTKRLWHSPAQIKPYSAHALLGNVLWLQHDDELYDLILESAKVVSYAYGQKLCNIGDRPSGVYIIVAGMVKVVLEPNVINAEARVRFGKIPNTEICTDVSYSHHEEDYFSTGFVIGETGCLTGDPSSCVITAETSLIVYHINNEIIQKALSTSTDPYDSLESHMWRAVGIRRAAPLIAALTEYEHYTPDKLQTHLLRSSVPIGSHDLLEIPPYVSEVVVIEGYAKNADTSDIYVAPFLVPSTCHRLQLMHNPVTKNRLLIVANNEDLNVKPGEADTKEKELEVEIVDLMAPQKSRHDLQKNKWYDSLRVL